MRILVSCECSNEVAKRFRAKGHYVISCDLNPNYESQEFHYKGDVRKIIYDGWDMLIGFPPCTHLAVSGARHFDKKIKKGWQQNAIDFFLFHTQTGIKKWCIENPVGIMSNLYRKPDQIIQPYYFGDSSQKTTCLWLCGLPKLFHAKEDDLFSERTHVDRGEFVTFRNGVRGPKWLYDAKSNDKSKTSSVRSKTFPGIAQAMAEQWG